MLYEFEEAKGCHSVHFFVNFYAPIYVEIGTTSCKYQKVGKGEQVILLLLALTRNGYSWNHDYLIMCQMTLNI